MTATDPFEALKALRATMDDVPDNNTEPRPDDKSDTITALSATVYYERKGRGGKEATIIEFDTDRDLADIARRLKTGLGTGGSVRGNEILLQGDRRQALKLLLPKLGIRAKGL